MTAPCIAPSVKPSQSDLANTWIGSHLGNFMCAPVIALKKAVIVVVSSHRIALIQIYKYPIVNIAWIMQDIFNRHILQVIVLCLNLDMKSFRYNLSQPLVEMQTEKKEITFVPK